MGFDGLSEAVEGSGVTEREVIRLRLQSDLDRVEGVFYILAHDTGSLVAMR